MKIARYENTRTPVPNILFCSSSERFKLEPLADLPLELMAKKKLTRIKAFARDLNTKSTTHNSRELLLPENVFAIIHHNRSDYIEMLRFILMLQVCCELEKKVEIVWQNNGKLFSVKLSYCIGGFGKL